MAPDTMKDSPRETDFRLYPAQGTLGPVSEVHGVLNNSLCFGSLLDNQT